MPSPLRRREAGFPKPLLRPQPSHAYRFPLSNQQCEQKRPGALTALHLSCISATVTIGSQARPPLTPETIVQVKKTPFKMKAGRLLIGTLLACTSLHLMAQEAPVAQEKGPAAADERQRREKALNPFRRRLGLQLPQRGVEPRELGDVHELRQSLDGFPCAARSQLNVGRRLGGGRARDRGGSPRRCRTTGRSGRRSRLGPDPRSRSRRAPGR